MNKIKRDQLRRSKREDQERRRLEKQKELAEALEREYEELDEEEGVEAVSDSQEEMTKDMDGMEMSYAQPTSFEELDQARVAEEKAHEVRMLTWDVQDLVRNILGHPMLKPDEKAKAIQGVGTGFETRLSAAMSDGMDMEKDLEVLSAEAILAHDRRHLSLFEKIQGLFKGELSAGAREKLPDSAFALVATRDGKKVRKYPVHDAAHTRNALARAAQQNDADAKAAMPKIRAAAKKFGIEMTMEKDKNAIVVEKDQNGDWRWVGWVSNQFIDFDGDIIAEDAHKEYIEWLDKNKNLSPVLLNWHTPGTACQAPADFGMYENGFLILSGKLTDGEASLILKAQKLADLGMSHGTLELARDPKDARIIAKYRMYEASFLPLENAANPWTDFETLTKEVDMDKKKYFASLIGEERAEAFLKQTEEAKKALEAAGVESKEKKVETPPEVTTEAHVKEEAPPLDVKAAVEEVIKQAGLEDLSKWVEGAQEAIEKVGALEELVKALQGNRDEELAEMITPPANRFAWIQGKRASASSETVLKKDKEEDDKLKKSAPGVPEGYWLSEATHTQPVAAQ